MPSCFVCGRSRTPLTKLQNITFHRFSADLKVREKWHNFLRANGLDVGNVTRHSLICSSHFDPSLFIANKNCRTLSKTAIPTIIISRVKSAKAMFPETKVCLVRTPTPILDMNKSSVKISTNKIDNERSKASDDELPQLGVSMKSNISRPNSPTNCLVENCSIQVSVKNIDCEGVSLLDNIMSSNSTSLNITVEDKVDSLFLAASSTIAVDNTPRQRCLELEIHKLSKQMATKKKQLKTLQQTLRRKAKKIASLKGIILQLKKENLIDNNATDILLE